MKKTMKLKLNIASIFYAITLSSLMGLTGCHSTVDITNPGSLVSPSRRACQASIAPEEIELGNAAAARTWMVPGAQEGIVFVSGVDGGFIEPVDGIYSRMAERNQGNCVSSIFVSYRNPGALAESIEDAQAAAGYLREHGVSKMAIVGWSFGGAVIAHAATIIPEIITIIGFSPQSLDTEPFALLNDRQSLLLFHSRSDENVPFDSSQIIMDETPNYVHKEFYPIDGANHLLAGTKEKIDPLVIDWLNHRLLGLPDLL